MSTSNNKRKRSVEAPSYAILEGKEYEDLLTCCVCSELVFSRVFLKCGHSFCKSCLNKSSNCPKCRGCKEGTRELLSEVEKALYEKILVECNQCQKAMNCLLAEKHKDSCWKYQCKNKGCTEVVKDQARHNMLCEYIQVGCSSYICKWKGCKKERDAHEKLHDEFERKQFQLERELEVFRQEYAVTVLHGHPKEQFVPLRDIAADCDSIEEFLYSGDQVELTIWNNETMEWEDLRVSKSDPRLVYSIADTDQQAVDEMKVVPYWIPDREEPDPGSQIFSS